MKAIFQDHKQSERLQLIKDQSVKSEKMKVRREFHPEEMEEKKEKQVQLAIKLSVEAEKLKAIKEEHALKTKPMEVEQRLLINDLKLGYSEEEEDVFLMANQEDKKMEYYTADGICTYERPLYPNERQTSLVQFPQQQASGQ